MTAGEFFKQKEITTLKGNSYVVSKELCINLMREYAQHKVGEAYRATVAATNRSRKKLLDYVSLCNEEQNRATEYIHRRFPV